MDFFAQEERARKQTTRLIWLFGLAVIVAVILNYVVLAAIILSFTKALPQMGRPPGLLAPLFVTAEIIMEPGRFLHWLWEPKLALWIVPALLFSIAGGCLYKIRLLARGGAAVGELLGGRLIARNTKDAEEKRLLNVVEEMAIASGMRVPDVFVLARERGINSFAAGHTREDVAIGVTYAALKLLSRDELQGMIAHEFSHVLNGDTRLNMKLMGLAHGLMWPTIAGRVLLRGNDDEPEIGDSIFDRDESAMRLPLVPIALPFLLIGCVSTPFVRLMKSLICREREWLADAAAVQYTRNPAGPAGALKKIGGLLKQGQLDTPHAESASHLYFANSRHKSWFGFQSTHPPLEKRIVALDPEFDGQFTHVMSLSTRSQDAANDRRYAESLRRARAKAQETEE